jgi:hypothetical protein
MPRNKTINQKSFKAELYLMGNRLPEVLAHPINRSNRK